jgi:hypothetical protein
VNSKTAKVPYKCKLLLLLSASTNMYLIYTDTTILNKALPNRIQWYSKTTCMLKWGLFWEYEDDLMSENRMFLSTLTN